MKKFTSLLLALLIIAATINAQCIFTSPFGSAAINASGAVVNISTCSFAGEFSTISGAVSGQAIRITSSVATDFITVRSGTPAGPVLAFGQTPLTFANTFTGTIYSHWSSNSTCGTAGTCRTTTVQCTSCSNNNDLCTGALPISCGTSVTGTTAGFTADAVATCFTTLNTAPGVWYTFVGNGQTVTLNTCTGTTYDSKIGVFSGTCASLVCVAGNDDFCGLRSQVTFPSVTGTTYYVLVTGFGTSTGAFSLTMSCVSPCTPATINAPTVTQPTCATPTGTIVVNATGSGTLEYSVDNGVSWQASATFSGLNPGNYAIRVRNQANPACIAVYGSNPVVLYAATLALTCPANMVTSNATGICGAPVTYSLPTVSNNCNPCLAPTAIPDYTYLGEFGGHRYFRSNFSRRWSEANSMATGLGAHLVTITSAAENNFLAGNPAWIGLTDEAVEGTFVWVTGEPVTYTNWWPGDPNNTGGNEDYVFMNFYGSTKWVDYGTNYFYPFIIEFECGGVTQTAGLPSGSVFPVGVTTNSFSYKDAANNTVTCSFTVTVNDTEAPLLTCPANIVTPAASPAGAIVNYNPPVVTDNCFGCVIPTALPNYTYLGEMGGHKYFRSNFSRTWPQANTMATALGGHLVTITSAAENSLVAGSSAAWIGLSRATPGGPFGWVTAEPLAYTNWWPGEPNNSGGNENYAMINYFGNTPQWFDYGTNYFYPFIVEFECNPTLTQTAGLPSGAVFPIGITTNSFSYTDGGSNTATCSFTVQVANFIHSAASRSTNPVTIPETEKAMRVNTYPNPSAGDFNLLVTSSSDEPITVRILDITGTVKQVQVISNGTKTLKAGADLTAGTYMAEVTQGTEKKIVKLVKIN